MLQILKTLKMNVFSVNIYGVKKKENIYGSAVKGIMYKLRGR